MGQHQCQARVSGVSVSNWERGMRSAEAIWRQVENGDVPFAPLHRADEGAVQSAVFSQLGLCPLQFLAPGADAEAQRLQEVLLVEVHGP